MQLPPHWCWGFNLGGSHDQEQADETVADNHSPRRARGARSGPGDELAYEIHPGYVILRPARNAEEDDDPALAPFLAFLADDLRRRPHAIAPITPEVVRRIESLVRSEPFDPDEPIEGDVAL